VSGGSQGGEQDQLGIDASAASLRIGRCPNRQVSVEFDPAGLVTVDARGFVLASASFDTRALSSTCRKLSPPEARYGVSGLGGEVHDAHVLRCASPSGIEIGVHAIEGSGGIEGSKLVVATRGDRTIIVSASIKDPGDPLTRWMSHDDAYCSTR
jgi:hypothetical protein